jgi:hypothetical protein
MRQRPLAHNILVARIEQLKHRIVVAGTPGTRRAYYIQTSFAISPRFLAEKTFF